MTNPTERKQSVETIKVTREEVWTVEWVSTDTESYCWVVRGDGRAWGLSHEQLLGDPVPPEVCEAARRCIQTHRELEEDECRAYNGEIHRFELRRGEYRVAGDWTDIKHANSRIREAHDRKFPAVRTMRELCDEAILSRGKLPDHELAVGALIDEILHREWRPISEFVEDGRMWEFCDHQNYVWTHTLKPRFATHFRRLVLPGDE